MPSDKPAYEVFPPKLNSPRVVTPIDPNLSPPNPNTTRKAWSNPSRTPVYGDGPRKPPNAPEPVDRGPNEANDGRIPVIIPGESWRSKDK